MTEAEQVALITKMYGKDVVSPILEGQHALFQVGEFVALAGGAIIPHIGYVVRDVLMAPISLSAATNLRASFMDTINMLAVSEPPVARFIVSGAGMMRRLFMDMGFKDGTFRGSPEIGPVRFSSKQHTHLAVLAVFTRLNAVRRMTNKDVVHPAAWIAEKPSSRDVDYLPPVLFQHGDTTAIMAAISLYIEDGEVVNVDCFTLDPKSPQLFLNCLMYSENIKWALREVPDILEPYFVCGNDNIYRKLSSLVTLAPMIEAETVEVVGGDREAWGNWNARVEAERDGRPTYVSKVSPQSEPGVAMQALAVSFWFSKSGPEIHKIWVHGSREILPWGRLLVEAWNAVSGGAHRVALHGGTTLPPQLTLEAIQETELRPAPLSFDISCWEWGTTQF